MEELTEKINSIREELLKVQSKIPAKDSNSALSQDKETYKQLFDTLLNQKRGECLLWAYTLLWIDFMNFLIVLWRSRSPLTASVDLQKKKKGMFDEVGNLRTLIKNKVQATASPLLNAHFP